MLPTKHRGQRVSLPALLEAADGNKWLTAGRSRFLVRSDRELPLKAPLCADGTLETRDDPPTFMVSAFTIQGASGS